MTLGLLGVLTGLALRLPFFPYSLSNNPANVLGAAVGAISPFGALLGSRTAKVQPEHEPAHDRRLRKPEKDLN